MAMKVWELIAALYDCEAGADVAVCRGKRTFSVELERIENEGGLVTLVGDGSSSDDEALPN